MAWIEIHQSLFTHRKTVVLAAELGTDLDAAAIKLIRLWAWCLDNAPEGDLSGLSSEVIAFGAQWGDDAQRFVDALMTAGYLNPDRTLHDWWDYAGKLIEQRRANAERMRRARASRASHASSTNGDGGGTISERAAHVQDTCIERAPATVPNRTVPNRTEGEIGGGGRTTNRAPAREEKPSPVESSPAAAVCSALEIDPGSGPGMAVAASITAHPEIDHLDQVAGWKLKNERWRRLSPTDRATRFRHWVGREVSFRAAAVPANGSRGSPNGSAAPSLREFPDDLPSEPTPLELKRQYHIERANEYRDQHNN